MRWAARQQVMRRAARQQVMRQAAQQQTMRQTAQQQAMPQAARKQQRRAAQRHERLSVRMKQSSVGPQMVLRAEHSRPAPNPRQSLLLWAAASQPPRLRCQQLPAEELQLAPQNAPVSYGHCRLRARLPAVAQKTCQQAALPLQMQKEAQREPLRLQLARNPPAVPQRLRLPSSRCSWPCWPRLGLLGRSAAMAQLELAPQLLQGEH